MIYEQELEKRGYTLPEIPEALGLYLPAMVANGFIFTGGLLPELDNKLTHEGKLGETLTAEQGAEAAKICALNALAVMKAEIGDLDKIKRIVRLVGYINSTPSFTDQPKVLNGASQFFIDILGENGKHARLAIGVASLPLNSPIEIEVIAELR